MPRDIVYGELPEKPERPGLKSHCPVKNRHEYGGEVEEWMKEFGFGDGMLGFLVDAEEPEDFVPRKADR